MPGEAGVTQGMEHECQRPQCELRALSLMPAAVHGVRAHSGWMVSTYIISKGYGFVQHIPFSKDGRMVERWTGRWKGRG